MRITNHMISRNSMTNMNNNKLLVDTLNNQMTSQKKISRPSDDPIIAIRALRLRSNLNEIDQYYEKNIPDAESWMELTETALKNMETILTEVYKECVNGSTDTLTQEDRRAILQNLQALRVQVYKEGNADNAGRTIFTGYKTNSQLTFEKDEPNTTYNITEKVSYESIGEKKYYTNEVTVPTTSADVNVGVAPGQMPEEVINQRIRLSYGGITGTDGSTTDITLTMDDGNGNQVPLTYTDAANNQQPVNVTTMSYDTWEASGFQVPANGTLFIPETGEIVLGKDVSEGLNGDKREFSVNYNKTGFSEGEIRPEHYFDCTNNTNTTNPIQYTKENQEISYTIAFNQSIAVNTQASDVFDASIGRDVDELTDAVNAAIAAHDKVDKIKEMQNQAQYADPTSQAKLKEWLTAAEKEATYMDNNMKNLYNKSIGTFQGYLDDVSLAKTDVGSKMDRVKLTKTRVSNQKTAFEKLKSDNEDRELSEIIVDYTASYTAYQASLMASSKATQQTLLNYI